ncbi:MAG: hypothetical protein PHT12_00710 [Patescibacteria group bacterium]|nr:hypothetical protein [Patescibacteria group bacterium]
MQSLPVIDALALGVVLEAAKRRGQTAEVTKRDEWAGGIAGRTQYLLQVELPEAIRQGYQLHQEEVTFSVEGPMSSNAEKVMEAAVAELRRAGKQVTDPRKGFGWISKTVSVPIVCATLTLW